MTPQLIGICGFSGAGKSTVIRDAICNPADPHNHLPIYQHSIMHPVKAMLAAMGIPGNVIDDKSRWDEPLDMLNHKTVRHAVITLGTDWARDYIGPDVWIDLAMQQATLTMINGTSVVIDGVRYWNECERIREKGGRMIAFHRPGLIADISQETERFIPRIQRECDERFENITGDYPGSVLRMRALLRSLINCPVPA
jgi:hypothetical protein